ALNAAGRPVSFVELSSPYGHDAFLLDSPALHVGGDDREVGTQRHVEPRLVVRQRDHVPPSRKPATTRFSAGLSSRKASWP
ncbi:MAG: hypothetical protein EOP68_04385, partial [Sphingomonas sp.]